MSKSLTIFAYPPDANADAVERSSPEFFKLLRLHRISFQITGWNGNPATFPMDPAAVLFSTDLGMNSFLPLLDACDERGNLLLFADTAYARTGKKRSFRGEAFAERVSAWLLEKGFRS